MTDKTPEIINWNKICSHDRIFQERKPTKWAYIEEFFAKDLESIRKTIPLEKSQWD